MKKEEKVTAVAELTEKFGRARLAILTECVGLPVNQVTELRKQLRGAKAEYRIVKNTLAARAAEGTIVAGLKEHLKGPTGVVIGYDDPRFQKTLAAIERHLLVDGLMMRYAEEDDFGKPETAFLVCTFWYIEALANCGRREEAQALFERVLSLRNHVGILSEDAVPTTGELWGNFPQTYSMVGIINAAVRLSAPWDSCI